MFTFAEINLKTKKVVEPKLINKDSFELFMRNSVESPKSLFVYDKTDFDPEQSIQKQKYLKNETKAFQINKKLHHKKIRMN